MPRLTTLPGLRKYSCRRVSTVARLSSVNASGWSAHVRDVQVHLRHPVNSYITRGASTLHPADTALPSCAKPGQITGLQLHKLIN